MTNSVTVEEHGLYASPQREVSRVGGAQHCCRVVVTRAPGAQRHYALFAFLQSGSVRLSVWGWSENGPVGRVTDDIVVAGGPRLYQVQMATEPRTGNVLVCWEDRSGQYATHSAAVGRLFTPQGFALTDEIVLCASSEFACADTVWEPKPVAGHSGEFLVASTATAGVDVELVRVDAVTGAVTSEPFSWNSEESDDSAWPIARDRRAALLAWIRGGNRVMMGTAQGVEPEEVAVSTPGVSVVDVALGPGNFLAWEEWTGRKGSLSYRELIPGALWPVGEVRSLTEETGGSPLDSDHSPLVRDGGVVWERMDTQDSRNLLSSPALYRNGSFALAAPGALVVGRGERIRPDIARTPGSATVVCWTGRAPEDGKDASPRARFSVVSEVTE